MLQRYGNFGRITQTSGFTPYNNNTNVRIIPCNLWIGAQPVSPAWGSYGLRKEGESENPSYTRQRGLLSQILIDIRHTGPAHDLHSLPRMVQQQQTTALGVLVAFQVLGSIFVALRIWSRLVLSRGDKGKLMILSKNNLCTHGRNKSLIKCNRRCIRYSWMGTAILSIHIAVLN